jgi:alkanesulfonate monooxygenase SsuD/methylene tetrahydromethanopterin reductase-like flavin-dependent oxidoreductase (luciferase family)
VLAAKQTAQLDLLSGGRLRVGVGIGWNVIEYISLGETFTNRGRRVDEQVALLRKLWTEPVVTFGKWHTIDRAAFSAPGAQHPISGGLNEAALACSPHRDGIMPLIGPDENGRAAWNGCAAISRNMANPSRSASGLHQHRCAEETWRSRCRPGATWARPTCPCAR